MLATIDHVAFLAVGRQCDRRQRAEHAGFDPVTGRGTIVRLSNGLAMFLRLLSARRGPIPKTISGKRRCGLARGGRSR
jgi:hypothetical protein